MMNIALTDHWEDFIQRLIGTGRYSNASEVVGAALRELEEKEGEVFPAGSLEHLYDDAHNLEEAKLVRQMRVPNPNEL